MYISYVSVAYTDAVLVQWGSWPGSPKPVKLPLRARIRSIAAGKDYVLALTDDGSCPILYPFSFKKKVNYQSFAGSVWSWGNNQYGVLGTGSGKYQPEPQLVKFPQTARIQCIAAGWKHCAAVTGMHCSKLCSFELINIAITNCRYGSVVYMGL